MDEERNKETKNTIEKKTKLKNEIHNHEIRGAEPFLRS